VLLCIFNLLFFVAGALLLAFGITGIANPTALTKFITSIPGVSNMSSVINIPQVIVSSAIFMIVLGSVMLVFGFLGCAGAMCDHKALLFLYWFLLILIICAEIALIIYAAVAPSMAETQIKTAMYGSLHKNFEPVSIDGTVVTLPSNVVAVAWVSMQFEVACCGVNNASDFTQFQWNNTFVIGQTIINAVYPPSCCAINTKNIVPTNTSSFLALTDCLNGLNGLNGQPNPYNNVGCYNAVSKLAVQYSYIPIIICACVIVIEVVAMAAAIYLWRTKSEASKMA
jgi:hypothetical protein